MNHAVFFVDHLDTLKGPVQYTDGYESALRISNPLRKAVSAAVTTDEQGVQQCGIPEYGFTFACPSGKRNALAAVTYK